jgi:hypothetical protein
MNKLLLVLGVLVAGSLLIPDVADARRGGGGGRGGGARIGGGGYSGNVGRARMARSPVRGVSAGRVAGVRPAAMADMTSAGPAIMVAAMACGPAMAATARLAIMVAVILVMVLRAGEPPDW